jgi:hypothetical protein
MAKKAKQEPGAKVCADDPSELTNEQLDEVSGGLTFMFGTVYTTSLPEPPPPPPTPKA